MSAHQIHFRAHVGDLAVVIWHEDEPRGMCVAEAAA
jgi:hypothetical protein